MVLLLYLLTQGEVESGVTVVSDSGSSVYEWKEAWWENVDHGNFGVLINSKSAIHGLMGMDIVRHNSTMVSSLAVRLPTVVVDALGLKEGDDIEIGIAGARNLEVTRLPGRPDILARLREYRGRLPADVKFDRLEANERG